MNNIQAQSAGTEADELIKQLSNPGGAPEEAVKVLNKANQLPIQQPGETHENWEKRFKNYKASTDTTIHKLRQQASTFDLMQNENAQLKEQLAQVRQQVPKTPEEALELFSQEEVDSMNKLVDSKVNGLQSELTSVRQQLAAEQQHKQQQLAMQTHQSVIKQVETAVPHYAKIDVHPRFKKYMNAFDEYGNNRMDLLLKAKNSTPPDINRIVQFYREFEASVNVRQETPQQKRHKQFTQQELLQNPTSRQAGLTPKEKPLGIVWDEPTIQAFYRDKALSKISADEAARLEQDMMNQLYKR